MKIIVSGGAGFIGSHICRRLLEDGHTVVCIDNFITGNRANIKFPEENPRFSLLERDINIPFSAEEYNNFSKIDEIYHLACPASPVDYKEIPLQTLWVSAAGTKNMLDLAVKNNAKILIASTSEVYGDPLQHPQNETYNGNVNPIGERSCYNEGKRYSESLAINYYKHFKIGMKIVRIFNTYGPLMRKSDGRVIPEFINRALRNEPLAIYGSGKQTRSFCYIDDMVRGLTDVMKTNNEFIGPVNIGNPDEITIMDLAKKIIGLTASGSSISMHPQMEDDPFQRQPDINLAAKTFGFTPCTGLDEGLIKTINFFKSGSL
jgi:UDP-glucuronate decarboxylase